MTFRAMFTGIAKPRPMLPPEGDRICELIPTSSSLHVHERAAGIATIDRRVRLQEVFKPAITVATCRAALAADDAHRDGLTDAERVADGEDDVADLHLVRISERHRAQVCGLNLDHRQVRGRVGADQLRVEHALVRQLDLDVFRAVDDVVVRQNVAITLDDHTGPEATFAVRLLRRHPELAAEQLAQVRHLAAGRGRGGFRLDADGDHTGRDALDDRGDTT